ncbi:DNA primase catalytic subunit PriS [Candidatus Alkanophaga liquidiphilum]
MDETTKIFVRRKFAEYYRQAALRLPPELERREWGFVLFDASYPKKTVMRRHRAFATPTALVSYLKKSAPAHVYYSSALYEDPAAEMDEKGWLGADLIFDLDADHIVTEKRSYPEMLNIVKKETLKLLDFLTGDFGFEENVIEVVFSGSRGYHVHVRDESVKRLGSKERREIVDYVTARGMKIEKFLVKAAVAGELGRRQVRREAVILLASEGWGKKLHSGLMSFLEGLAKMDEESALRLLLSIRGIGEKRARELMRVARNGEALKNIRAGNLDQIPRFPKRIWERIIEKERVKYEDRPDEPVTADVKRLIRMPTSLHGKTGFLVKPMTVKELEGFDPLEDAVVFGDEEVRIKITRPANIFLKGATYKVEEGVEKLPVHAAVFLMCAGVAELS